MGGAARRVERENPGKPFGHRGVIRAFVRGACADSPEPGQAQAGRDG